MDGDSFYRIIRASYTHDEVHTLLKLEEELLLSMPVRKVLDWSASEDGFWPQPPHWLQ